MYRAHRAGIETEEPIGLCMVQLMNFLESNWQEPDEGIWEVRGGRKNFTHSKMMAWVAFDRAVKLVEECGCAAADHLAAGERFASKIHAEVCERGYNSKRKRLRSVTAPTHWMPAC